MASVNLFHSEGLIISEPYKGNCELNWAILYFHCCKSIRLKLNKRMSEITVIVHFA